MFASKKITTSELDRTTEHAGFDCFRLFLMFNSQGWSFLVELTNLTATRASRNFLTVFCPFPEKKVFHWIRSHTVQKVSFRNEL